MESLSVQKKYVFQDVVASNFKEVQKLIDNELNVGEKIVNIPDKDGKSSIFWV